ncbi:hypothetical protein TNCV_2268931 [Trichonephila clavipes]|nr:hypothetical protein TNCV_2268931 [Trichonephila clavipes]
MATGSYLTPNHFRSQSEIQGDLHNVFVLERHTAPTAGCDGMGCHCLQYTVTSSIDPDHHDIQAVCP